MIKIKDDAPPRPENALESYERKPFEEMTDSELLEAAADALSDYIGAFWEAGSYAPSENLTKALSVEMWKRCGRIPK